MSNIILQGYDESGQYITQGYTPGRTSGSTEPAAPGAKLYRIQNISPQPITILYRPPLTLTSGDTTIMDAELVELGQLRNLQQLGQILVHPRIT